MVVLFVVLYLAIGVVIGANLNSFYMRHGLRNMSRFEAYAYIVAWPVIIVASVMVAIALVFRDFFGR